MAITFYLQSIKNPASIYVRIREGRDIDAKAKTNLSINPERFDKGKIKKVKVPNGATAESKAEVQKENSSLINLEKDLAKLSNQITTLLNEREDFEIINSDWLKNVINPKVERMAPSKLVDYFEHYIDCKGSDIATSTVKKIRVFKNRVLKYEKTIKPIYIENIDLMFITRFEDWLRDDGYAKNTIIKTIKTIKEVCYHSKSRGIKVNPEVEQIGLGKDYVYKRAEHITLNEDEIQRVETVKLDDKQLDIARDWLVISLHTAQRVSDFLRFKVEDIVDIEGSKFIDFRQQKTDTPVYIILREPVLKIIEKRGGKFPPIFSDKAGSNSTIYNKLIKLVCKEAKINELVTVSIKNKKTNRYELKEVKKYLAVSTHIGRRSFATNYYTHIDTMLLMSQTGHKSTKQFMDYVSKADKTNATSLAKGFAKFDELNKKPASMKVLHNTGTE
ncbi:integrase [Flavobacterium sp. 270]|uniref:phage integrase SAM-like domain-containing protein n=1 Tax=Flavobacterium sp. 270 TaxID=2512114 RepID=UPI001066C87D|nr:phage integrase SAM-like domain-containing protein [Flavobacterium sp. 270]TDW51583.1 integrase [Flavobacterium sp. 270]